MVRWASSSIGRAIPLQGIDCGFKSRLGPPLRHEATMRRVDGSIEALTLIVVDTLRRITYVARCI